MRVLFGHRDWIHKALLHMVVVLILGVFVFGYNPYVTNTVSTGNPFYRVIGEGATNTVDGHVQDEFLQKSRAEKFFVSILSRSMNSLKDPPELKFPFTVGALEIIPFLSPDTRIGGWGPLFGGVFILAVVMMILAAFQPSPHLRLAMLAGIILSCSVFIFPEPWWARYVPQVWILPFIAILLSYYLNGTVFHMMRRIALIALALNVFFVTAIYIGAETWGSLYLHRHLSILSRMSESGPLSTTFQFYYSNRVRLQEAGVRLCEKRQTGCENPVFFDRMGRSVSDTATMICVDRQEYERRDGMLLPGLKEMRRYLVRNVLKGGASTDGTPLAGG